MDNFQQTEVNENLLPQQYSQHSNRKKYILIAVLLMFFAFVGFSLAGYFLWYLPQLQAKEYVDESQPLFEKIEKLIPEIKENTFLDRNTLYQRWEDARDDAISDIEELEKGIAEIEKAQMEIIILEKPKNISTLHDKLLSYFISAKGVLEQNLKHQVFYKKVIDAYGDDLDRELNTYTEMVYSGGDRTQFILQTQKVIDFTEDALSRIKNLKVPDGVDPFSYNIRIENLSDIKDTFIKLNEYYRLFQYELVDSELNEMSARNEERNERSKEHGSKYIKESIIAKSFQKLEEQSKEIEAIFNELLEKKAVGNSKVKSGTKPESEAQANNTNATNSPNLSGNYSILYLYTDDLGNTLNGKVKMIKSDISGKNKTEIATFTGLQYFNSNNYFVSRYGKYFGKLNNDNIEIASATNPTKFNKIVTISDKNESIGSIVWPEESNFMYETVKLFPNASTIQDSFEYLFNLFNIDSNIQKVVVKSNIEHASLLGFNTEKNELYLIVIGESFTNSPDELLILNLSTGELKNRFKIPENSFGSRFSPDFRKFYYVSNNEKRIIEYDFTTKKEITIFEAQDNILPESLRLPYVLVTPPRDERIFFLILGHNDPNYRKVQIFNPSNGKIDIVFESSDPQYRGMHIDENAISADNNYIWIEADGGFYILDVKAKKMNKFIPSSSSGLNESVGFVGWLVE